MEDKKITNRAPLNDKALERISGGTSEPEANPYDICRVCGADMFAANVMDYSPFDIIPACVCRKCGHEEY